MLFTNEFFATTIAAILTLFVYSYLLRDNPLYRLAEHLLIATGVAYAVVVASHEILLPRLITPLRTNAADRPDLLIPLVLGLFLLGKAMPRGSRLGNPSMGYLIGMGLGLATGGALVGTLIPQTLATMLPILPSATVSLADVVANLIIIIGTLLVLFSFLYLTPAPKVTTLEADERILTPRAIWRTVGRWFMMITFGSIFGGMVLTYISLLVGRWDFLINDWLRVGLGF